MEIEIKAKVKNLANLPKEVFQYQDFEIVLDKVKKLGNFIEVEVRG